MRAVHGTISGRVQGVGFRYSTRRRAAGLGLTGWVRNTPAGTVEVFAQGPDSAVAEFVAWLRHGPAGARVVDVTVATAEIDPSMRSFVIR